MTIDGAREGSVRRLGEEVARLRTAKKWARAKLIARLFDTIESDDPVLDSISEAWLKRLENGQMVKVPRRIVEALCRALGCTPQERVRVLVYADRNVLGSSEKAPDAVAEALNYTMGRLYDEAYDILADVIGQRRANDLTEKELFELSATALELVIKRGRRH